MNATMKLSEAQVTKQIIDFLRAEGWRCIRLQSGLFQRPMSGVRIRIGEPGMPDWLVMKQRCPLYAAFLEIKGTGKTSRPDQVAWRTAAQKDGFTCEVFDNFETFLEFYRGVLA